MPRVGGNIGVANFENELYSGGFNRLPEGATEASSKKTPPSPSFFLKEQQAQAKEQWTRLSQIGTAPNYFGQVVLAWAKAHPDDARVPEALHLVVRSTRYGCTDGDTSRFSRQAFERLHSQYPKSQWAKQTPYWF